jgi:hypothetical protein
LALALDAQQTMQDLIRDEFGPSDPSLAEPFEVYVASFSRLATAGAYRIVLKDYFSAEEAAQMADFLESPAGRPAVSVVNAQLFHRFPTRAGRSPADPTARTAYQRFTASRFGQKWLRQLPDLQKEMFEVTALLAREKMKELQISAGQ